MNFSYCPFIVHFINRTSKGLISAGVPAFSYWSFVMSSHKRAIQSEIYTPLQHIFILYTGMLLSMFNDRIASHVRSLSYV